MAAHAKNHDYHLVDPSPWPVVGSISAFVMALGAIMWMHEILPVWLFLAGVVGVLYTMFGWWSDVIAEANSGHDHTPVVQMHHRYGMILFIASEVMFFVAWFWAYFDIFFGYDSAIQVARVEATGGVWPPVGVELFDPWHLPLFNTLLLLTSGTTVTWAHHALLEGDREGPEMGPDPDRRARPLVHRRSRPSNIRPPASPIPAMSMAAPSSWRPASTASTSSSARSFWR